MTNIPGFKAYDIRGKVPSELNVEIVKEWIYGTNANQRDTTPTIAIKEIPNALWSPFMYWFKHYYN